MKHVLEQPFVFATGLAALVHSTWALGTLFAGPQPIAAFTVEFIGWLLPALLIAFALDVGQIATSNEIRAYGMTWARGLTFITFAGATYYLQWLYIAHHMPALELAPGVRESWSSVALLFRDSAIWLIPALLPASTLLYTFSGRHEQSVTVAQAHEVATITAIPTYQEPAAPALPADPLPWLESGEAPVMADEPTMTHEEPPAPAESPIWADEWPLPWDEVDTGAPVSEAINVTQAPPKEEARENTPRKRKNSGPIVNEKKSEPTE